ncbi:DUF2752 domain-containing protein [Flavobacteriaceae bacterium 14752]|uniref:DUF2752 domain-containing protein n=1 Tax=Mesohalobacter salilacus TaxID=2491711 RepID=UPI000F63C1B2|nr:DUF2752 domain-containing protein [Flavobacteriaceae bacterium 14752]
MTISKPIKILLITVSVLVGLLLLWMYYSINPSGQSFIPKCPFHSITGYHCPGCGSQRALHDFLHGRIIEGFQHNVLIGLGLLVMFYKIFLWIRSYSYPQKTNNLLYHPKTAWVILVLVLGFWILRNIPFSPFNILAP